MQRSLLPRAAPELPGLELGDVYESAARVEVGGDVYDYLTLGDGRLAVVLGDVTGHGVDAAADMAMAKYVFRSLAREHVVPGEFLAAANEVVSSRDRARAVHHHGRAGDRLGEGRGCVRERRPSAAAARPAGRHGRGDRGARPRARDRRAAGVRDGDRAFPPGAIVVAYTDGVVEARRARRAVRDRAARRAARGAPLAAAAGDRRGRARRVPRVDDGGELKDDFAVVVIKRSEPQR